MPYISIGDISLHYVVFRGLAQQEELNPALPTAIVLHGGPGFVDHSLYTPFWSSLSLFMQVVFPDQRGNGLSEHGDSNKWNLTECGKDVVRFCAALKIEKPVVVGISWGGYVAMSYATQHPDHPKALIFCNTEAKVSPEARKEMFTKFGGNEAGDAVWAYDHHPEKEGVHETFIKHCMPHYARRNPYKKDDLSKCKTNFPMRVKFMREENLTFDYRQKLKNITCPVLLFAGDCDAAHPLKSARETAESIPDQFSRLVVLEDAGAPVYNDQPARVYATTLNFIAENDPDVATGMPETRP